MTQQPHRTPRGATPAAAGGVPGRRWLVGAALVAVAASVVLLWADHRAKLGRRVHLVNGTGVAYEVEVNGRRHTLPAKGVVRVVLAEGTHRVRMRLPRASMAARGGAPGAAEAADHEREARRLSLLPLAAAAEPIELRGAFLRRVFAAPTVLWNPDEAAVIRVTERAVGRATAGPDRLIAPARVHRLAKIDYVFWEPPEDFYTVHHRSLFGVVRTRLSFADGDGGPAALAGLALAGELPVGVVAGALRRREAVEDRGFTRSALARLERGPAEPRPGGGP